jgi:hypothetical protein
MQVAQQRDALRQQKFHFRKSLSTSMTISFRKFIQISLHSEQTPDTPCLSSVHQNPLQENECKHRLMTINEIINGSVRSFFLR